MAASRRFGSLSAKSFFPVMFLGLVLAGREDEALKQLATSAPQDTYALLMGYEYHGLGMDLDGPVDDIHRTFNFLTTTKGVPASNIVVVSDVPTAQTRFPGAQFVPVAHRTAAEALHYISSVFRARQPEEHLVFHFAGHGDTQADNDGDELDGLDEYLYITRTEKVLDDQFYTELSKISEGVNVVAMVDACHSEGFADLPFNYQVESRSWCTDWAKPKDTLPMASITYFSGAKNSQYSDESEELDAQYEHSGRFTKHALTQWTQPTPVYKAMQDVRAKLSRYDNGSFSEFPQEPCLLAFPTFRDTELLDPFNPATMKQTDPSHGGSKSAYAESPIVMQVPSICVQGNLETYGLATPKNHKRRADLVQQAKRLFQVNTALDSASTMLDEQGRQEVVEGWVAKTAGDGKQAPQYPYNPHGDGDWEVVTDGHGNVPAKPVKVNNFPDCFTVQGDARSCLVKNKCATKVRIVCGNTMSDFPVMEHAFPNSVWCNAECVSQGFVQ